MRTSDARSYTVYMHTSPSGKVYIGITSQEPAKRWVNGKGYKHSPHLRAAIEKYGWDAFKHDLLAEGLTKEEACAMEVCLIAKYNSTDRRFGYNAEKGGDSGAKHSIETKRKIGEANKSRKWTPEARQKLRAYKLAHPTTPETARKIGEANRGRRHRPESIEKIKAANPGKSVRNLTTDETYDGVNAAARSTGISASHIVKVCKGKRKSAGGFRWAYEGVIA